MKTDNEKQYKSPEQKLEEIMNELDTIDGEQFYQGNFKEANIVEGQASHRVMEIEITPEKNFSDSAKDDSSQDPLFNSLDNLNLEGFVEERPIEMSVQKTEIEESVVITPDKILDKLSLTEALDSLQIELDRDDGTGFIDSIDIDDSILIDKQYSPLNLKDSLGREDEIEFIDTVSQSEIEIDEKVEDDKTIDVEQVIDEEKEEIPEEIKTNEEFDDLSEKKEEADIEGEIILQEKIQRKISLETRDMFNGSEITIKIPKELQRKLTSEFNIDEIGTINLNEAEEIANEEAQFLTDQELQEGLKDVELVHIEEGTIDVDGEDEITQRGGATLDKREHEVLKSKDDQYTFSIKPHEPRLADKDVLIDITNELGFFVCEPKETEVVDIKKGKHTEIADLKEGDETVLYETGPENEQEEVEQVKNKISGKEVIADDSIIVIDDSGGKHFISAEKISSSQAEHEHREHDILSDETQVNDDLDAIFDEPDIEIIEEDDDEDHIIDSIDEGVNIKDEELFPALELKKEPQQDEVTVSLDQDDSFIIDELDEGVIIEEKEDAVETVDLRDLKEQEEPELSKAQEVSEAPKEQLDSEHIEEESALDITKELSMKIIEDDEYIEEQIVLVDNKHIEDEKIKEDDYVEEEKIIIHPPEAAHLGDEDYQYRDDELDFIDSSIIKEDYGRYLREIDYYHTISTLKDSNAFKLFGLNKNEIQTIEDVLFKEEYKGVDLDEIFERDTGEEYRPIAPQVGQKGYTYILPYDDSLNDSERNSIEEDLSTPLALIFEEDVDLIRHLLDEADKEISEDIQKAEKESVVDDVIVDDDKELKIDNSHPPQIEIIENSLNIDQFIREFPKNKQNDIKKLMEYFDGLFEKLPESTIQNFANSEYYEIYRKVLDDLGM